MKMVLELNIHPDGCDPNSAGEALMRKLNSDFDERWGYSTREFKTTSSIIEDKVDIESELIEATLCCGCFAKDEYKLITKYRLDDDIVFYLYWDGDGTIVFKHLKENWMLYNGDMKKSNEWEWVEEDNWVYKLPETYYDVEDW